MAHARVASKESSAPESGKDTAEDAVQSSSSSPARTQGLLQAAGPMVGFSGIQAKPVIGSSGDRYEQEADAVARQVSSGETTRSISRLQPGALGPQRQEEDEEESVQKQSLEEEEEEAVQQKAAEEDEEADVQAKKAPTRSGTSDARAEAHRSVAAQAVRSKGPGRPMHEATRRTLERRMGADFSHVRVHDGPGARSSARKLNARAFTHGPDVWLGPGASDRDLSLMAHEATHVLQQGAAERSGRMGTSGTVRRREREEEGSSGTTGVVQGSWLSAGWGAVKSGVEAITATASEIAGWAADKVLSVLGDYLPDVAMEFIHEVREKGIVGALYAQIKDVVATVFDVLDADESTLEELEATFLELRSRAERVVTALAEGECEPLFAAVSDLKVLLSDVAGRAWEKITEFLEPVADFLADVWDKLGAPIVEWIEEAAGETWGVLKELWSDIKGLGEKIGSVASELGSALWGRVKDLLGFDGGESDGEEGGGSGIGAWIKDQASAAWDKVTEELQPILDPIDEVVSQATDLLPLDAIADMQERVEAFQEQVGQMDEAAATPDDVAGNQARLREAILPAILNGIDTVRSFVGLAKSWLTSTISGLTEPVTSFFSEMRSISLLSGVAGALEWVESGVQTLVDWATGTAGQLFDVVDDALQGLKGFVRPVYRTLMKIVDVLGDFAGSIKDLIAGSFWGQIPACIREKIEEFLVHQILANVPFFNKLTAVKDIWDQIINTAYTALYQVFVDGDLLGAAWTVFRALLRALDIPEELVLSLVNNALKAFNNIFGDPIGFLINVAKSVQLGFQTFIDNFGSHVLGGLQDWVFGALRENGIEPPTEFSFQEVFRFLVELFDVTLDSIFDKVANHLGVDRSVVDRMFNRIQRVIEVVGEGLEWVRTLTREGPSALWNWLQDKITGLWASARDQLVQYITIEVVQKAVEKLALALTPTGVSQVVAVLESIWSAIQAAAEYVTQMIEVVNSALESVNTIAEGTLEPAAARIENTLSRSIPVAIGFLSHQVGLGDLPRRFGSIIESVRDVVDEGLDTLIGGAIDLLRSAVETVRGGMTAAKERLVQWWRQSVSFTRNGDSHSVGFEGEEDNARLVVASTPTPVQAFLSDERERIEALNDEEKKADQRETLGKIEEEVANIQDVKSESGYSREDGKDIQESLNEIARLISELGDERELPPSQIEFTTTDRDIPIANTDREGSSEDAKLVEAKVLSLKSNKHSGSQPTQRSALWNEVNQRSGEYVRGHLLNHHVHGPGIKKNLTPITRSLNSSMESEVESEVKERVLDQNKVVSYTVEAVYADRSPQRTWLPAENYMPTHLVFDLKELSREEGADGSDPGDWGAPKNTIFEDKEMTNELPPDTNPFAESVLKKVNLKAWDITNKAGEPLGNSRSIVERRLRELPGIGEKKVEVLLQKDRWSTWDDLRSIKDEGGGRLFSEEDITQIREEKSPGEGAPDDLLFTLDDDAETLYEPLREGT